MLYKGYVETKGKASIEKLKNRTTWKTYDEVKNLNGFGGVLADDTILIDIDDSDQSEILMNIVEELQLDCKVLCTSRGKHFQMCIRDRGIRFYLNSLTRQRMRRIL